MEMLKAHFAGLILWQIIYKTVHLEYKCSGYYNALECLISQDIWATTNDVMGLGS